MKEKVKKGKGKIVSKICAISFINKEFFQKIKKEKKKQNKWFKVQDKEKRKEREIFKDFQK